MVFCSHPDKRKEPDDMDQFYDVIIIGGGAAATSAAMTLHNRGKSIAVVANRAETGSLYKAEMISNYPGLPPMSGTEMTTTAAIIAGMFSRPKPFSRISWIPFDTRK